MFSRSVSGRPLRKRTISVYRPWHSDRLFKASISLSQALLGYLPSNRLRAYALVVDAKGCIFRYLLMKLWRKPYYQAARVFRCFLFYIFLIHTKYCFYKSVQPNASLRALKKFHWHRTNEVRLYDIGISFIALLYQSLRTRRYALRLHMFTDLLYNGFQLPEQQKLWGILRFHLFLEELPSGFRLQFHVRDAWLWIIFFFSPLSPFPEVREEKELLAVV